MQLNGEGLMNFLKDILVYIGLNLGRIIGLWVLFSIIVTYGGLFLAYGWEMWAISFGSLFLVIGISQGCMS